MAESREPAYYLVFHPENQRRAVAVRATAIVRAGVVESWAGNVWVDAPGGNEDPFVLGPSWAYSFCHATQLRRQPRRHGAYVTKGSCILFCSGDYAEADVLAVDTVFWIAEAHPWVSPSRPPSRYEGDIAEETSLWKFHLQFGGRPEHHQGKYTYEAALYPQPDRRYSRLPLDKKGMRVQVELRNLTAGLQERITRCIRGRYPVLLSGDDLCSILKAIDEQTAVAVVGDIVPNDDTFIAIRNRQQTGCLPCRPGRTRLPDTAISGRC